MDAYLISALNEVRRLELLRQSGLDVEASVEGLHSYYFGSNFAQAWFLEYGAEANFPSMNERINKTDPEWVVNFFDGVLARLDDNGGQMLSRDKPAAR